MNYPLWEIPEIWPNSTVFVVGGGVSILQQDLTLIHNRRVIGVNQSYKLGPWVDVCWFGDKNWYDNNLPEINGYGGLIVTCSNPGGSARLDRIKYVGRSKREGLEYKKRTHVGWNSNSGTSAINLAYWLGARTVVLLGFDMKNPVKKTDFQSHWHNDYEKKIDKRTGMLYDPYPRYLGYYKKVAHDARKMGLRIINATPNSALEVFEKMTLEKICETL